jgi:Na+/H+-dicarboxylate symporter
VSRLLADGAARIRRDAPLGAYVFVVLLGLGIQQFGVYSASVWWLGGMRPTTFFRGVRGRC